VGFDELAALLLSPDVLTTMVVTSGVISALWFMWRRFQRHLARKKLKQDIARHRSQRRSDTVTQPDVIAALLRQVSTGNGPPKGEGWIHLATPDLALKAGDPLEHKGENFWIKEVHQSIGSRRGNHTYIRIEPFEKAADVEKALGPRTRYDRMLEDWDDD